MCRLRVSTRRGDETTREGEAANLDARVRYSTRSKGAAVACPKQAWRSSVRVADPLPVGGPSDFAAVDPFVNASPRTVPNRIPALYRSPCLFMQRPLSPWLARTQNSPPRLVESKRWAEVVGSASNEARQARQHATRYRIPLSVFSPVVGPEPSRAWALVVGALECVGQNPTVSPLTPPFHLWDGICEVASAVVSRSATNHGHPLTYPRTSQLGWKIIGVPIGYIWQGRVLGGE